MLLIVLAGFAVWNLGRALARERETGALVVAGIQPQARWSAVASILFWTGAIVAGRLIGYTIGPPPL
jgi:hypothetical protein